MVVWMCAVRSWAEVAPAAASTTQCGGHFFPLRGPCVIEARRLRLWDGRYDLMEDGHPVATWERSHWTRAAIGFRAAVELLAWARRADLPGLPRVVALFAVVVVLTRWASDGAATG